MGGRGEGIRGVGGMVGRGGRGIVGGGRGGGGRGTGGGLGGGGLSTLLVTNVPKMVGMMELSSIFGEVGRVKGVKFVREGALIEYMSEGVCLFFLICLCYECSLIFCVCLTSYVLV